MSHIIIKKATVENALEIATILCDSWKATYKGVMSQCALQRLTPNTWVEKIKKQIGGRKDGVLIAKIQNKAVGVISFGVSRISNETQHGEIYALYILPNYVKQGIGTNLLQVAMKEMACYHTVDVVVVSSNKVAKKFYEKHGFFDTKKRLTSEFGGGKYYVDVWTKNEIS